MLKQQKSLSCDENSQPHRYFHWNVKRQIFDLGFKLKRGRCLAR